MLNGVTHASLCVSFAQVDSVWESENSASDTESSKVNDSSFDYHSQYTLRPRRKRVITPVQEINYDIYMDQTEEYGYSSMGRKRKRRIIPNNAEDQQAPKKSAPALAVLTPKKKVVAAAKKPIAKPVVAPPPQKPNRQRGTVASTISRQAHSRQFEANSPSKSNHLMFQRGDGERFSISEHQTLLIRTPNAQDTPTQLLQISGSAAIKNPGLLNQLLNSGKLGPGSAAIIVQNEDAATAAQALQEEAAKTLASSSAAAAAVTSSSQYDQSRASKSTSFPAFQFKTARDRANRMNAKSSKQQDNSGAVKNLAGQLLNNNAVNQAVKYFRIFFSKTSFLIRYIFSTVLSNQSVNGYI